MLQNQKEYGLKTRFKGFILRIFMVGD